MSTSDRFYSRIPLHAQLHDQVKTLMLRGTLTLGRKLPGVRELATYLGINRHTVSRALHDLEDEGLVVTIIGRGTFVAEKLPVVERHDNNRLAEIVDRATRESRALGISIEELVSAILARGANGSGEDSAGHKLVFIECNRVSLEQYAIDLRKQMGVQVEPLLISDLRRVVEERLEPLENCDLVVTTLGHLPEVRRILGNELEIFPIAVGPYLKVFLDVLALPKDSKVGIVTASENGSQGMKQAMVQAGIPPERLMLASMERPERLTRIVRDAQALVVSFAAMGVLKPLLPTPPPRLIEYLNVLDQTSIEALKERLRDFRTKKSASGTKRTLDVNLLDLQRALQQD
jgi:GntR family transcriptional regulator